MIFKHCNVHEFVAIIQNRDVIVIGTGKKMYDAFRTFCGSDFFDRVKFLIDNNESKQNTVIKHDAYEFSIRSVDFLRSIVNSDTILLITTDYYDQIINQLDAYSEFMRAECYIYPLMDIGQKSELKFSFAPPKIPKIIHYCWFGKSEIPNMNQEYISTWKRHCPDYELVRWDESNFDVHCIPYARDAYLEKKWAFVSDYARLAILYHYGGIYFDTDVELIKNIDCFLSDEGFAAFENLEYVATGLGIGAIPHHPIIREMCDVYHEISFYQENGELNLTACPVYQTEILERHGLKRDNSFQIIDGFAIYPQEVFCPLSPVTGVMEMTENTFAIHHFDASWFEDRQRAVKNTRIQFSKDFFSK